MPYGDGTGPEGFGPRTGRGLGYCSGYNSPGFTKGYPRGGAGYGRGYGRGFGFRRFWGFRAPIWAETYPANNPVTLTKEEQKKILEDEKKDLEEELKRIKEKIEELE